METEHSTHIIFLSVKNLFIICAAQECKHHYGQLPVTAQSHTEYISASSRRQSKSDPDQKHSDAVSGHSLVLSAIPPQFPPAKREQELHVCGSFAVEAQLFLIVVAITYLILFKTQRTEPVKAELLPVCKPFKVCIRLTEKIPSSICSNSRVRKVKFPGVISLRKDLPICPIPNGIFFLEVLCTFLKFTKIPCAVSGRRYTVFFCILSYTLEGLEHQVELTDLCKVVFSTGRTFDIMLFNISRHLLLAPCIHASFQFDSILLCVIFDQLSARNLSLHSLQSINGSLNPPRCPDAIHVCGFIRIAQSTPTLYGLSCTNFFHHAFFTLFFSSTPRFP